jgi:hypothetical protein
MASGDREGHVRKSLICCVLLTFAAFAAGAQTLSEGSAEGWVESPYRNFGPPQVLLPGRAVLFDEADDSNLRAVLSADLRRLFNDLYVRQGWHFPFADGEPIRIFVARKEAGGLSRVTSRSVEGGRLVGPAVLLDVRGLTSREIVREVARQVALATLARYGVADGSFVTQAAAILISSPETEEDREPARIVAAASELSLEKNPETLGRLYLEELTRAAGSGLLRSAWERASESGEEILPVLLGIYAERTGESEDAPLLRFGARLYSTLEVEASPSRVSLLDLEAGALDAAPPAGFALRHRTFLPAEGAASLRVSWPEDGGSGAVVVRYRDTLLPPDVLFLSRGDVRNVPLGGVARLDWVVAGGFPTAALRAPVGFEQAGSFPYAGLIAHAAGSPDGPRVLWNTASHEGLAGWAIFREEVLSDGRISRTGPEILPSSDRAEESFGYAYLDPATTPGTFYRYTVWAVTKDGLLSRAFSVTLRTSD